MKKLLAILLAMAMVFALVACGAEKAPAQEAPADNAADAPAEEGAEAPAAAGAIKIGMSGPLTGGAAVYGTAVQAGMEIAVEEINALGGLQFELNCQDDEHDAEKAVNGYNALKDWGMDILAGTVTSTPCQAVAPMCNEDSIFLLTPSASADAILEAQKNN